MQLKIVCSKLIVKNGNYVPILHVHRFFSLLLKKKNTTKQYQKIESKKKIYRNSR